MGTPALIFYLAAASVHALTSDIESQPRGGQGAGGVGAERFSCGHPGLDYFAFTLVDADEVEKLLQVTECTRFMEPVGADESKRIVYSKRIEIIRTALGIIRGMMPRDGDRLQKFKSVEAKLQAGLEAAQETWLAYFLKAMTTGGKKFVNYFRGENVMLPVSMSDNEQVAIRIT